MKKYFLENYHNHLLFGITIGHYLLKTYNGTQLGFELFMTAFISFVAGFAWEGGAIITKLSDKFDKVDCGLVVVGGLLTFLIPENIRAYCVYAFVIFGFVYFIQLITKRK